MRLVARSCLAFALVLTLLLLAAALSGVPFMPRQSALAAPEGQDALNVERLSSYGESEGGPCCRQVVAVEEYAYVVGSTIVYTDPPSSKNLVDVYNISDAQNPVKTRSFGVGFDGVTSGPAYGYTINDIFVSGDGTTAFIAYDVHSLYSRGGEFWALNLGTNPPSELCSFYIPDDEGRFAHTVVGHGQYAYVGTNNNITILDTSTADANGNCQKVGQYDSSGASDLERVGNLLYLSYGKTIEVLSISNPQSPSFVSSFTLPEDNVYDLTANAAGYVFAATSDGVFIVDTFNPGNVRIVGTYAIGSTDSVTLDGAHLYVGTYTHGLRVVDVSDPAAPTEVGYYVDTGENRSSYFLNVFFADGFLHTPDGIYRYRPDGPEPCPQSEGPDPCRPLEFKVTHPTVQINNQPVAVNNSQPLRPGDQITLSAPRGAGETRVRCHEAQYFVALARYADSEEEGLGEISVLEIASYHEELVQRFCTSPPTASAQGGEPDLVFTLESGAVQAQGQVPNLLLNIGTASATVQSTGMNIFNVAHLPDTGATRVGALNGTVEVVPTNSALPPVTLQRNQQVTVTASEVSPVTPYGSSVFLPLTWK